MPTLVLLRHAEAARRPGVSDLERELTDAGRRQAADGGRRLAAHLTEGIDVAVVSPSVRTRETFELSSLEAGEVWPERRVYEASVDDLMVALRELPDAAQTVLLVGHAPGVPALAQVLLGEGATALQGVAWDVATWGVLDIRGTWAELAEGQGDLRHLEHTD